MKNYLQIPLISILLFCLIGQVNAKQLSPNGEKLYPDSAITYSVNIEEEDSVIVASRYFNCSSSSDKYKELLEYNDPTFNYIGITEFDPTNNKKDQIWYNTKDGKKYKEQITSYVKGKLDFTDTTRYTPTTRADTLEITTKNSTRFFYYWNTISYGPSPWPSPYMQTDVNVFGLSFLRGYQKDNKGNWEAYEIQSGDTLTENTNGTVTIYNGENISRTITFDTANNTTTSVFYEDTRFRDLVTHIIKKGTKVETVKTLEGYPVRILYYELDSLTSTYKLYMKTEFTYDSNMNLINRTSSAYIKAYDKWISIRGFYQKYDIEGNLLEKSEYSHLDYFGDITFRFLVHDETSYLTELMSITSLPSTVRIANFVNTYYYYSTTPKENITEPLKMLEAKLGASLSISQVNTELGIYPNPAHNETILKLNFKPSGKAMIYNLQGQLMQTQTVISGDNNIDLSLLKKGMYIIKVPAVSGIVTGKILKKKIV